MNNALSLGLCILEVLFQPLPLFRFHVGTGVEDGRIDPDHVNVSVIEGAKWGAPTFDEVLVARPCGFRGGRPPLGLVAHIMVSRHHVERHVQGRIGFTGNLQCAQMGGCARDRVGYVTQVHDKGDVGIVESLDHPSVLTIVAGIRWIVRLRIMPFQMKMGIGDDCESKTGAVGITHLWTPKERRARGSR